MRWWFGLAMFVVVGIRVTEAQMGDAFALKVVRLQGQAEVVLGSTARPLQPEATVAPDETLRVAPKSLAVVQWLPHKALVKVEENGQVKLLPQRVLQIERGRVWIGTPPPPPGERRYPLPVRCGLAQLIGTPDASFSVALQPDRPLLISVDEGSVFVTVGAITAVVNKEQMLLVTSPKTLLGPFPMSREERLRWDMGGAR